jgi:hypothetical protein
MSRRFFLLIFFYLTPLSLLARDVSVDATLNTNPVAVGDRITLTAKMIHPAGEQIILPSIEQEPFIMVWDSQTTSKPVDKENVETTTRTIFSSFVIGEHRVSTNEIKHVLKDGSVNTIPFPDLLINVVSILSNPPPELADIKPSISLPGVPWIRPLVVLAAIVAAGILLALIIRLLLRRKAAQPVARIIPPHELALNALNALLQRGHIERGEIEPFYVELSAIIRVYLEQRFDLHAPEQTTEEFIRTSSRSVSLSPEHRMLTQSFLEQSDLVKFARYQPGADDMKAAWSAAEKLVRETIPSQVETTGGGR